MNFQTSKFIGINRKINCCSTKPLKSKRSKKGHSRSIVNILRKTPQRIPVDSEKTCLSPVTRKKLFFSDLGISDDSESETEISG